MCTDIADDFSIPLAVSVHSDVPTQSLLCSAFANSFYYRYTSALWCWLRHLITQCLLYC